MSRRTLFLKIGLTLLMSGFFAPMGMTEHTVQTGARFSERVDMDEVRRDLAHLDALAAKGNYADASVVVGKEIKVRDIYRGYLKQASAISEELLAVRIKLDDQERTVSLQQLGALAQRLSLDNLTFRNGFTHGEEQFESYKLIEKAIYNLEDAIRYWRISSRYRRFYRGYTIHQIEDDEILQTKLQTAMNAIDELKAIMDTRRALSKDLEEE